MRGRSRSSSRLQPAAAWRACRRAAASVPRRAKALPFSRCRSATATQPALRPVQQARRIELQRLAASSSLMGLPPPARRSASATSSRTSSSRLSSSASSATNSLPMPAMMAMAKGEIRRRRCVPDMALDGDQEVGEAADVGQADRGLGARGPQQHVVRLVLAQHVVDQVRAEGDLPPGLLLARDAALDQPGDDGTVAEGPAHQRALGHPLLELVAQDVDARTDREHPLPGAGSRRQGSSPWPRSPAAAGHAAPSAGSAACPASAARSARRSSRRPDSAGPARAKVSTRSSSGAGTRRPPLPAPPAIRAPAPAARRQRSRSAIRPRTRSARCVRERQPAAGIGRHLRVGRGPWPG